MMHIKHHHNPKKTREDIVSHFQMRCMERLGFIIRQRDLKDAMANLESGLITFIRKQSNSKTHFKLSDRFLCGYGFENENSMNVVVVYDRIRHNFVTVLLYAEDGKPLVEGE